MNFRFTGSSPRTAKKALAALLKARMPDLLSVAPRP